MKQILTNNLWCRLSSVAPLYQKMRIICVTPPGAGSWPGYRHIYISLPRPHHLHHNHRWVADKLRLVQIIVIILPGNVFVMAAILIDRHLQSVANYLILSLGNFQLFQRMGWFVKYMTGFRRFRWFRHTFFLCVTIFPACLSPIT